MHDEIDQAIDEALGGEPRANELQEMIAALETRRATYERERRAATNDEARKQWTGRIAEVEKQIRTLREEAAITGFVESSVRFVAGRPHPDDEDV